MSCIDEVDICVIRGDTFQQDVGLSSAWSEVLENPTDFQANLVFREFQDDNLTPYLTLTAPAEINPDPLVDEVPIMFRFTADSGQTQALPEWDIVAYCELEYIGPVVGFNPVRRRLFNSDVETHD